MAEPCNALGPALLVDPRFLPLLAGHSLHALDRERGSVVGLWPDERIALYNSAWHDFAQDNGGAVVLERWPLGSSLLTAISGPLRDYYARAFERVRVLREPWEQNYECPSPSVSRQFRLRVLPLAQDALLLVHSLISSVPLLPNDALHPAAARYVGKDGMIHQCSNCRRTQSADTPEAWDWVPAFVTCPPRSVSHGICALCLAQFYSDF